MCLHKLHSTNLFKLLKEVKHYIATKMRLCFVVLVVAQTVPYSAKNEMKTDKRSVN